MLTFSRVADFRIQAIATSVASVSKKLMMAP